VAALAPNWIPPDSMQEWPEYVRQNTQDKFWMESQPAFNAYDYGTNIEIDVTEQLRSVPKETRLRRAEDDSDSGDESFFSRRTYIGTSRQQSTRRNYSETPCR
jgi:hypothetical protein